MITLTPALISAAGLDAGNARMRKAGRTVWNRADYNHAAKVTQPLWDAYDLATLGAIQRV